MRDARGQRKAGGSEAAPSVAGPETLAQRELGMVSPEFRSLPPWERLPYHELVAKLSKACERGCRLRAEERQPTGKPLPYM